MNMSVRFFAPTPAQIREHRRAIEHHIETLIAMLDVMDDDPDLEDGGDAEPWLGAAEEISHRDWYRERAANDDREAEEEHDEDGGDCEPWLAWPERGPDVLRHTCDRDRELEEESGFADYEAMTLDLRGEPWLGWTDAIDQARPDRLGRQGVEADLEEAVV